jgi:hypothetical protein
VKHCRALPVGMILLPVPEDAMLKSVILWLPTIASGTGAIAAALTIADRYLSDSARRWISDKAETLWICLSYQTSWPYLKKLQDVRIYRRLLLVA